MQKLLLLATTAVIVSLDSFVAGFSISLNKKQSLTLPATVALVTLILCLLTTFIGNALKGLLDAYVDVFSATVLVILALYNLLKEDTDEANIQPLTLTECVTIGVAVGTDAGVANLSLAVNGYGIVAPVFFAVTHYFTVFLGQKLAGKITMPYCNYFSAAVLFALAAIRLI